VLLPLSSLMGQSDSEETTLDASTKPPSLAAMVLMVEYRQRCNACHVARLFELPRQFARPLCPSKLQAADAVHQH
jgi:hypothetical protein